jgi:sugar lactone lactonase YvrE
MPPITSTLNGLGNYYISTSVVDVYQVTTVPGISVSGVGAITSALIQTSPPTTSTVAGSTYGSANGQLGTFNSLRGIVLDSAGNIYVSDYDNNRIRRITPSGNVSTYAGSGAAGSADGNGTSATFNNPYQLAIDPLGNIYVVDRSSHKIRKIDTFRNVTTIAGSGTASEVNGQGTSATFNTPSGIAIDSEGFLYVSGVTHTIRRITPTGYVTTYAGTGSAGANDGQWNVATFNIPLNIAFGSNVLYVADTYNEKIRSITETRTVSTYAPSASTDNTGVYQYTAGLAFDSSGNLYLADQTTSVIWKITNNGATITAFAGALQSQTYIDGQGGSARFNQPTALAFDTAGNMYVTDLINQRVRKIDIYGNVSTYAGSGASSSTDGIWHNASFNLPYGIAVDSLGAVYVAENAGNRIKKITNTSAVFKQYTGVYSVAVDSSSNVYASYDGQPGSTYVYAKFNSSGDLQYSSASGGFSSPSAIAVDSSGAMYVADTGNNAIKKISTDGNTVTTHIDGISQPKGLAFFGDTLYVAAMTQVGKIIPAGTSTTVNIGDAYANSIAIDSSGNIYMTLPYYNQVRKYSSTGTLLNTYGHPANSSVGTSGWVDSIYQTDVRFNFPTAIAVASGTGNIYIADTSNHVIRQITPSGITTTLAGTPGGAGYVNGSYLSSKFNEPYGIALDSSENAYVTDRVNCVIRKLSGGQVTTYAGAQPAVGSYSTFPLQGSYQRLVTLQNGGGFSSEVGNSWWTTNASGYEVNRPPLGNNCQWIWSLQSIPGGGDGGGPYRIFYSSFVNSGPAYSAQVYFGVDNYGLVYITGGEQPTVAYYNGPYNFLTTIPSATIHVMIFAQNGNAQAGCWLAIKNLSTNAYVFTTNSTWEYRGDQPGNPPGILTQTIVPATSGPIAAYTNGSLSSAQFNNPVGITYLSSDLYVADLGNNAIRKITSSAVTTVAGLGPSSAGRVDGPTSSATFTFPYTIATYGGNLYVTETNVNNIRLINLSTNQVSTLSPYTKPTSIAFDSSGTMRVVTNGTLSFIGISTSASFQVIASGFTNAMSLCLDSSGNIYVADQGTNQIKRIDTSSNVTVFAGTSSGYEEGARLSARFSTNLIGICMIGGVIYVADNGNGAIRTIHNDVVSTYATGLSPGYIAVDSSGIVYVANAAANITRVLRYVATFVGSGSGAYADGTGTAASFNGMFQIAIDTSNNIYVADTGNRRIRKVTFVGTVTTLAGSGGSNLVNGPSATAQFNPVGVYVDSAGLVYITDRTNNTIRLIYPDGYVTSIAGSGTYGFLDGSAGIARFALPRGLVGDSSGNIYVADQGNNRLRKIALSRTVATFAGTGVSGTTNGAAASATFNVPIGIAVDGASVYVADFNPHDIRKISGGQVTTYAGSSYNAGSADGTSATFNYPRALTTDSAGNVYVADDGNYRVRKISPYSYANTIFYASPTDLYKLPLTTMTPSLFVTGQSSMYGITCDRTYVYANCGTMIKSFHMTTGTVTILAGTASPGSANGTSQASVGFDNLQSIAIDPTFSNLYACDFNNQKVRKIQLNPLSVTTHASVVNPIGIAIDSYGTYAYVTSSMDQLYRVSLLQQNVVTFLASVSGYPQYISLDPTNTYAFIPCITANVIRQVNLLTNAVTTIAGSGAASSVDGAGTLASFNQPYGIAFNPNDAFLYSTDRASGLLRKIATQVFLSSMIGLTQSKTVPTILPTASITTPQAYEFIYNNGGTIRTTPNLSLLGNTITAGVDIRATGYTVTAKTFTAKGTVGGGYYVGDGTGVTVTSDIRTKENIQPIRNALDIVRKLQAVEYTKIDDPSRRWIGYIAQDVEQLIPHIVRTDASPEQWKSIQYTYLPGLIIEALKELKMKIEKVESLLIPV